MESAVMEKETRSCDINRVERRNYGLMCGQRKPLWRSDFWTEIWITKGSRRKRPREGWTPAREAQWAHTGNLKSKNWIGWLKPSSETTNGLPIPSSARLPSGWFPKMPCRFRPSHLCVCCFSIPQCALLLPSAPSPNLVHLIGSH